MKLTELNPRWIGLNTVANIKFYIGVSFMCPCCMGRRLAVKFWPPIDPENLLASMGNFVQEGHKRTGDTFGTLTLSPSVGFESIGHWHGHIINGDMI